MHGQVAFSLIIWLAIRVPLIKCTFDFPLRWDIGAIDSLPAYMKFIYKSLLDVYNEAEESLAKEGRLSYGIQYVEQTVSFRYQFLLLSSVGWAFAYTLGFCY